MTSPKLLHRMAKVAILSGDIGRRCKHVAFIHKGPKLLAVGVNNSKTHPVVDRIGLKHTATQCAELNACLRLGLKRRHLPDFSDLTMTVVRVGHGGTLTMSRPCPTCQQLLKSCGFKKVIYSDETGALQQLW